MVECGERGQALSIYPRVLGCSCLASVGESMRVAFIPLLMLVVKDPLADIFMKVYRLEHGGKAILVC
jgi:hypothetical protein